MKAQTKQTSKDNMFQSCPHFCNIQVGIMSCIHVGINTGYLMCSDRVRGFLLFAWGVNVSLASQKQLSKECQYLPNYHNENQTEKESALRGVTLQ